MTHKFAVSNKDKLDNPKRRALLPPHDVLLKLGLPEGAKMADVGCGIGYFAILSAVKKE